MVETRARGRWAPFVVAAAWMALGWANLARGTAHVGVPYRPWAFDHHSYSDLIAMAGDRYFHGGRPIPYLTDRIEYPPLLGLALWLPSFVPGGPLAYFTAGYGFLAACGLVSIALLLRMPGTRPWWLAGTPALAYYAGLNWDLLPIALLIGATLALERRRSGTAGALVALGFSAKLWPVSLAPPAIAAWARQRTIGAPGRSALAAALVTAAVNAPVAAIAPAAWSWFWVFNAARGAENSIWEVFRQWPSLAHLARDAAFVGTLSFGALACSIAFAAWAAYRGSADDDAARRAVRLGTAFIIVAWMTTNKVWSPQYALWACAAGALAAAPSWLFAVHAVLAVVDYHVAFETRSSRGVIRYFDAVYTAEEVVRCVAYVALAVWIGRELWRVGARGERVTGPRLAT